jgi:preprotein translocase subunit SecB
MALVVAHCRFVARAKDSEEEAVVISADYEVFLGTSRGFTDEFFTIYRDLSLPVNVWPYFREFVQNMLGRAGYPPFTLPLLMRPAITEAMSKRKRVRPK